MLVGRSRASNPTLRDATAAPLREGQEALDAPPSSGSDSIRERKPAMTHRGWRGKVGGARSGWVVLLALAAPWTVGRAQEPPAAAPSVADDAWIRSRLLVIECAYPRDKKVKDDSNTRVQAGFLLEGQLAVTRCSGLIGAESRTASRLDVRKPGPIRVVAADLEADLAIVELRKAESGAAEGASVLGRIGASEADFLDRGNFTLWFDPLNPKQARAIAMSEVLPEPESDETGIRVSRTAGTLSGLPVVDGGGALVGLWQWSWGQGEFAAPAMVPATKVFRLLEQAKSERMDSFDERVRNQTHRSRAMPVIRHASSKKPSEETGVMKNLVSWFRCDKCGGDGTIDPSKADAIHGKANGAPCTTCRPSHPNVAKEDERWKQMRVLAARLCSVSHAEDLQKLAGELENGLAKAFELNPAAMTHTAYDGAKQELMAAERTPGRAIALIVPRELWPSEDESVWGERVRRVVGVQGYPHLLLRSPYARATIGEGRNAFVAAVVAGSLTIGQDDYVVLERAMVVPINSTALPAGR